MPQFQGTRMKVQLKLCINRLKMLQKKKANLAAVARKEIAALLDKNKDESAHIKVEHIIREDFMIEALELVELYCDVLLARFGLIESLKYPEESIKEAIATLIWVTPLLASEVTELGKVRDHLVAKYGKDFATKALENSEGDVNDRMIHRLNIVAPDPILVTRYLSEIAKSRGIDWEPPAEVSFDTNLLGDDLSELAAKFDAVGHGAATGGGQAQAAPAFPPSSFAGQQQNTTAPYPTGPGAHSEMPVPQHFTGSMRPMKPLFGSSALPPHQQGRDPHGQLSPDGLYDLPCIPDTIPNNTKGITTTGGGGGVMDAFDDLESRFRKIAPGGSAFAPPPIRGRGGGGDHGGGGGGGGDLGPPPPAVDFDDLTARFNKLKKS